MIPRDMRVCLPQRKVSFFLAKLFNFWKHLNTGVYKDGRGRGSGA